MKKEITIPEHFPDLKEDGLASAAERRKKYSTVRDIQAKEFNEAIITRLIKEKENQIV